MPMGTGKFVPNINYYKSFCFSEVYNWLWNFLFLWSQILGKVK